MTEYRIYEYRNQFFIQTKYESTWYTGALWWKKKHSVWKWSNITFAGLVPYYSSSIRMGMFNESPMPPFGTLEEAKAYIKVLRSEPKIHTV